MLRKVARRVLAIAIAFAILGTIIASLVGVYEQSKETSRLLRRGDKVNTALDGLRGTFPVGEIG